MLKGMRRSAARVRFLPGRMQIGGLPVFLRMQTIPHVPEPEAMRQTAHEHLAGRERSRPRTAGPQNPDASARASGKPQTTAPALRRMKSPAGAYVYARCALIGS